MANIVLIEDDPSLRQVVGWVLESASHVVHAFENGRPALEHIEREPPDLLITDIFMPEMEGLETIRRVLALRPGMRIIAISGLSRESADYLQIAEKFGAVATLSKPFKPAELLDLVSQLLAQQPD